MRYGVVSLILAVLALTSGFIAWVIFFNVGWPRLELLIFLWPTAASLLMALTGFYLSARVRAGKLPCRTSADKNKADIGHIFSLVALVVSGLLVLATLGLYDFMAAVRQGKAPILCPILFMTGLILLSVLIGRALRSLPKRCPMCGRFKGKEISAVKVPGTERESQMPVYDSSGGYYTTTTRYVKYRVFYRCQACGHRWSKEKTR